MKRRGCELPTYHQGIAPALVSLVTGTEIDQLPERLTISMLPTKYAMKVARHKKNVASRHPSNKRMLVCKACGRKGQYDLGLVVIDPVVGKLQEQNSSFDMVEHIQCTGYFRCMHCNHAGEWSFPSDFSLFLTTALLVRLAKQENEKVTFGTLQMSDGFQPRWATDGEAHILQKMRAEGQDAFVWNRLGNLYLAGGRPELAVIAFEQSLCLDVGQLESHLSLADMLNQIGEHVDAAHHFRQVLVHARHYRKVDSKRLRDMLVHALQHLFELHLDKPDTISFIPTPEEYGDASKEMSDKRERVLEIKEFSLEPDQPESFYALAESYMGIQQTAAGSVIRSPEELDLLKGQPVRNTKIGRNEPCPCGSGKKYKKCCAS